VKSLVIQCVRLLAIQKGYLSINKYHAQPAAPTPIDLGEHKTVPQQVNVPCRLTNAKCKYSATRQIQQTHSRCQTKVCNTITRPFDGRPSDTTEDRCCRRSLSIWCFSHATRSPTNDCGDLCGNKKPPLELSLHAMRYSHFRL